MNTEDNYWLAGGEKHIPHLTSAALRFTSENGRLLRFTIYFLEKKLHDEVSKADGSISPEEVRIPIDEEGQLLLEMSFSRITDNFLSFLSELLALIYKARPEMLNSSEQERFDYIFQFKTMDELRDAVAEKKVERLAFMGLRELSEYISKNMGLDLFKTKISFDKACEIIEYRNVITHNRGIISTISARRLEKLKNKVGSPVPIDYYSVKDMRDFIENCVYDIDVRAAKKFNLPVYKIPNKKYS